MGVSRGRALFLNFLTLCGWSVQDKNSDSLSVIRSNFVKLNRRGFRGGKDAAPTLMFKGGKSPIFKIGPPREIGYYGENDQESMCSVGNI